MEPALRSFLPADKLFYVPNGVDTWIFRNHRKPRLRQVCMIGSLRWQKGYNYALSAFAQFAEKHPDWQLVIAGEGPLRDELNQQVHQLDIDDKVRLLGTVDRATLISLLNQSSVLMLSSVSEGFPKVILEAMACGTPVVATDVGSCGEIVPGAGIVVPPKDVAALSKALCQLAENNAVWQRYSETACKRAAKYEWANVAARVEEIYSALAK